MHKRPLISLGTWAVALKKCVHAGEVHKWENDFEKPNDKFVEMIEDVVDKVMLLDEPAAQVD